MLKDAGGRVSSTSYTPPWASVTDRTPGSTAAEAAEKANITEEGIARAQAMWNVVTVGAYPDKVAAALTASRLLLFRNLFQMDPHLLELFPFKDEQGQPIEEELAVHANKVMSTVGFVIANLRNLETLVPILRDVHTRHIGYGVKLEHYDTLSATLLVTFAQALGRELTPNEKAAYGDVMTLVTDAAKDVEAARKEALANGHGRSAAVVNGRR